MGAVCEVHHKLWRENGELHPQKEKGTCAHHSKSNADTLTEWLVLFCKGWGMPIYSLITWSVTGRVSWLQDKSTLSFLESL